MPPITVGPACPVGCAKSATFNAAATTGAYGTADRVKADAQVRPEPSPPGSLLADALDPGPEPINAERVAHIRKAIEDGTYPLVPATVADAFIAAGFILRNPR